MRFKRSHYCGVLRAEHIGQELTLCGWVDRRRDHGGVIFIDLRDREGVAQTVFDPSVVNITEAHLLRSEYVVAVRGKVRSRPQGMKNPNLATGDVELVALDLEILNKSETPPFLLHEDSPTFGETDESIRLTNRYLDLRRPALQKNLRIRHEFLKAAREFYYANGFWEIETPILYKSTPEGARDFLVPSRLHPGQFYALPQSPQTLKQLCMISGFDRYVQIARCFRDEDLRADRQPEFTQIDVEMSFIDENDIYRIHEQLMQKIWRDVLKVELKIPFRTLKYSEAIAKYGSDKPDLRNPLTLTDLTPQGKKCEFELYRTALEKGAILKCLCFEEREPISRSELDGLLKKVAPFGARGIGWIRIKGKGDWQSPQAKFFDEKLRAEVENLLPMKPPVICFLICDKSTVVHNALGSLRLEYGRRLGYQTGGEYEFLWVTDFPLFEYNEEDKRFYAAHHPFTSPHPGDLPSFLTSHKKEDLEAVRARAYDLVLNGVEIGGGSLRIYDQKVQSRMFELLGISEEDARVRFGFFLRALQYGTPPHGGIALGVDRIAMILAKTDAIRDVIAFPKTQKATCLMSEAPTAVDEEQLRSLSLQTIPPE